MITYKDITVTKQRIQTIECDKCHKVFDPDIDYLETQEFLHIRFVGGYGSIFGDEAEVACDLCQHCLKEMIKGLYRTEVDND